MRKKILITGISGFIGSNVARHLLQKKGLEITGLVRPGTNSIRLKDFDDQIQLREIDLENIRDLRNFLDQNVFDQIIHIGALRGGRKFPKQAYFDANVNATEQIALSAKANDSELIFCSSVGVFGAIPLELPANNFTRRQEDNYYHFTKIRAEAIIQKLVLYGLKAVIIRPAISYGVEDYGFPYTLTRLVDKKLMFLPDRDVMIHLTNVEHLANVFLKLSDFDFKPGSAFNIADVQPVKLPDLVNFISEELHGKPYPKSRTIDYRIFEKAENLARFMKNELWISRFELISKSWFYDVQPAREEFGLKAFKTIPGFHVVTDWYKNLSVRDQ
ncbi:MAG: NAD(P)-dependent oxidoreductase [Candidatus Cloacimonadales bacterium]|nr:NAD(P)-dependent oxidoreductase [Candidatus Cloacimonadales bacterium]